MMTSWLGDRPLSNFCLMKNEVLTAFCGFNSESIDEVFISHVDSTALNPIWRFGESMAESTALPTFFFMLMALLAILS